MCLLKKCGAFFLVASLLVLVSGCKRMGSSGAYDEGVDLLISLDDENVTLTEPAETPVPPEAVREKAREEKDEKGARGEDQEVTEVEHLTPVTNAPLPALSPGIRVDVKVSAGGIEEVTQLNIAVSGEGDLYLPLIKATHVEGMTRLEAVEHLKTLYKKYYRSPEVEVIFHGDGDAAAVSPWGYVTVNGRVMKPGRIPLDATQKLMLSDAIGMAGGLNTSAKDRSVHVTREKPDGTFERQIVNFRNVAGGQAEEDIELRSGDKVYVPESWY